MKIERFKDLECWQEARKMRVTGYEFRVKKEKE
jgi:hypothetical protein